ncbi:AAA family ATPase [Myxococcota bacterium]|nr:AAA family ATPase [Myxococcota bacterium]
MDTDYSDALARESRDLLAAARQGALQRPRFRQDEIARVLALLSSGRSVLLVGPAGVGKTAVVQGLAGALADGAGGKAVQGLVELSTSTLLAGTRYLGEWQTKLRAVISASKAQKAAIYLSDVWNLPTAGRSSSSDSNMLDALRPELEQRAIAMLAEATPSILRQMQKERGFVDLFERVELHPLTAPQVDETLDADAAARGLRLEPATRRALVDLTHRFLPHRHPPGPALELLAQVAARAGELPPGAAVPPAFVEQVFAARTGLPAFIVSRQATMRTADVRAWFTARVVGQEAAVDAIVECITLFKAGLQDPQRPLGTFLFVGPTGVGKTELARALATFLFGSPDRLLRFDLGEFKDFHAAEVLLGSARQPERPATLVDPVRAQPFQIVLFDELEKAHENVWDLLLSLLDEGRLTPPSGEAVDFRNTIVICTSNAGAEGSDKRLGFLGGPDTAERQAAILQGLSRHFRPELLNRFGRVVVFHPLSRDQVRAVARQELARVLRYPGITDRGLVVDVDDSALDLAIDQGHDERFGARALKRQIQHSLVLPLAQALMEQGAQPGQILRIDAPGGRARVRVLDSEESRAARAQARPVQVEGRRWTRQDLAEGVARAQRAAEDLALQAGAPFLRQEATRLRALRQEPDFWTQGHHAAQALRDLDLAERELARLDRLALRARELEPDLAACKSRDELATLGQRLVQLEQHLVDARRELVTMGRAGLWDALVELRPVGGTGAAARDLVARGLEAWAGQQGFAVDWLCEPLDAEEPCVLAIRGPYATGLLRGEAGLHRWKAEDGPSSVVRVRVGPWTDRQEAPVVGPARALKREGALGHAVRSRLELIPPGRKAPLLLQGPRTLEQARALAAELAGAWAAMPAPSERRVRRYDAATGQVRDALLGDVPLHPARIAPERLHPVLLERADLLAADPSLA